MDLYEETSKVIKAAISKKASLKTLVYGSAIQNKKSLYALVCETVKHRTKLLEIGKQCPLLQKEHKLHHDDNLLAVLLYEHILGRGVHGRYKGVILRHKNAVHTVCERMKMQAKVTDVKALFSENQNSELKLPKYVRVNTLKTTLDEVKKKLQAEFTPLTCSKQHLVQTIKARLDRSTVIIDPYIPDLLIFHHGTDLHAHPLYQTGAIILQDKASCMPAFLLSPHPGSHVIDCCAAPGNKTSHLAAIMHNTGKVDAFDRDRKRLATLQKMVKRAGATCVTAQCRDFLTVDPTDALYADVEYILVDPSCSGSGMADRVDIQTAEDEVPSDSMKRLQQLSTFQITILKHALSFPNVKKVVYSTCSIHEIENEQVVEEVLSQTGSEFGIEALLPDWPMRGLDTYDFGRHCLRMSPDQTLTNGFFVCCFKRKSCRKAIKFSNVSTNNVECIENRKDVRQSSSSQEKTSILGKRNNERIYVQKKFPCSSNSDNSLKATTNWMVKACIAQR